MLNDKPLRLRAISASTIQDCRGKVGDPDPAPWPVIAGCLTALCAARSGSTLLCRQIETVFEVGEMGEKLNPPNFRKCTAQAIVAARREPWFAYKCSVPGLICAELSGFVEAYLAKTVFIRLLRRDILAQAVSRARAYQTGRWHSTNEPTQAPVYDKQMIATSVRRLVTVARQLKVYAENTGRPHAILTYEDIATNGVAAVEAAGDLLGLPRRGLEPGSELFRPVAKMGDAVNDEWKKRFEKEMSAPVGALVERYLTAFEFEASTPPAKPAESARPDVRI